MVFHLGYFIGLTEAYRAGDMGQVYPIARGIGAADDRDCRHAVRRRGDRPARLDSAFSCSSAASSCCRCAAAATVQFDRRAVGFALFTAVTICGYSVVDGIGARAAGNAHAYTAWLFVLDGLDDADVRDLLRRGAPVFGEFASFWKSGLIGGVLSLASYWIAIWAMTVAPIALVAALRETSVLFAAVIAVVDPEGAAAARRASWRR